MVSPNNSAPKAKSRAISNARLLIVDDDSDVVTLVEHIARSMGFQHLRSFSDSREAMACLKQSINGFDIIICDYMMPNVSGIELAQIARTSCPGAKFIFLTANSTLEAVKSAKDAGVAGFITKPFTPNEFRKRIRSIIERRQ